jgi:glycosyltransferase involved in cell wall biosynthesis
MSDATIVRPLVSAIIIFLDGRRFLGDAIESVLAQGYPEWELLLVDDGSTDGASDVARRYAAAHPEAQMTFGPTRLWFGWTGRPEDAGRDVEREIFAPPGLYRPPEMLRRYLAGPTRTPATCSVLLRREALAATGGFEERFTGLYEDQVFFVKTFLKLACYVTADAHDLYRQHDASHMADAVRTGRYSDRKPTRAQRDLALWCAGYLLRERVGDPALWRGVAARVWAAVRPRRR